LKINNKYKILKMKNMNKTILGIVLSLGLIVNLGAQSVTSVTGGNSASAGTNIVFQVNDATNCTVTKVTLSSTVVNLVKFFDGGTNAGVSLGTGINAISYTNGPYTNWSYVPFTNVVAFTNSLGRLQTNSYIGISNSPTLVAAGSNNYPAIGTIALAAATPYTVTVNWNISRQLWVASTNAVAVIVEYSN
jgi:hypothetical protein